MPNSSDTQSFPFKQVIDQGSILSPAKKHSLVLENICLVNAYYDIMSNTFKPAPSKCTNRLPYVRITPLLVSGDSPEQKSLRSVPFLDSHSHEQLCMFRAKWSTPSSQSSPNATTSKAESSHGPQGHRDSTVSSHSKFSTLSPHVPILNPIYFCISSPCQKFSAEFGSVF